MALSRGIGKLQRDILSLLSKKNISLSTREIAQFIFEDEFTQTNLRSLRRSIKSMRERDLVFLDEQDLSNTNKWCLNQIEQLKPPLREEVDLEVHPVLDCIPMMNATEFAMLQHSIQKNGQEVPITMLDRVILDGRNRYLACKNLGIKPKYQEYLGNLPIERFIMIANRIYAK